MSQQSWTESLKVKDLTEQIGQGFGILNTEGKFEHVNAQLAEMLGYNQEELSGISYHSLFKMDGTDFILNDTIHEKEITLITKTREDIAARLTVKSLNDNTDRLYILLTKIDYGDYRLSSDFLKALDLASPRRMVVGRDLKIQYVSTAFMEANPEQLIGFSALEGVREEYRDGLRNVVEAVFEEGVIGSIEISDSTDTEPTQWFVLRISPIRQGDSVIAVVITSIDITERIHTENALRESEEKFRGIFENANDGIILTNERGHINAVNSAYEKLYSVKRNEILDKPLWEVQASLMSGSEKSIDFQEQLENTISNFYETGDAPWLNKVTQGEFIHPESGSRIDLEQQAFKIPSSNGFMLCSFVWDITERNRIEDARKRSEQLYRALFEQNNDAVFILDLEGNHIDVNHQAAELLGYTIDELKEIGMNDTVVARENDDSQRRLSDMLNGKTLPIYERTLLKKNGNEISVDVNVSLVRDGEGNPLHIQSIMRDITDMKRTLQSLKESEERLRRDRRIFHDLAKSFIQAKEIEEMTGTILNGLAKNYGFDFGLFVHHNPTTNMLDKIATIGVLPRAVIEHIDLSADDADSYLVVRAYRTKKAIFISDFADSPDGKYFEHVIKHGAKSVMAAPILDGENNVLAVYSFATKELRVFDESDLDIFSTITRMIETVFKHGTAELQKESAQESLERERKAFQSIANAMVHTSDTGELSSNILKGLTETLGFDFGTIRLYDEKEEVLRLTAIVGMEPTQLTAIVPCSFDKEPQHLVSYAAVNKEKIIASDVLAHESTLLFKERLKIINVKSVVIWPILDEADDLVGMFSIGSYTPQEISETTRPFFDAVAGMLNTLIERKKTEQALRISERRYRELITDIAEGVGNADLDERLVFVNKAFAEILGYTPEELVGMSLIDLVDPEDIPKLMAHTEIRKEGKTSDYTHQFVRKNGERITVRVSAVPSRDDEGNIDGTVAFVTDITEQIKSEEALKESEARFRNIFETSPVGMHLLELNDENELILIDSNPAANEIIRRSGTDRFQIGQPAGYEIQGQTGKLITDKYNEIMRTGIPWNTEDVLYNRNSEVIGAVQLQIFRASPRTIVTSFLDISERVIAEKEIRKLNEELAKRVEERTAELAAANKELEAFAYSVSHDLRAPLRTLDGFSQALLEDYSTTIDETGQDYLQRIRSAAKRMGGLIEDVLGLSRVTRIEMDKTDVNLSDIAREIISDMTELDSERSVDFRISEVAIARCDRRLIKVAVQNLLENAWKFTGKVESPKIEFGTEERDGRIVFFVRDNGAGFEMKYKEKLFTPFQRLHQIEEFEGSGIGLATVQRVINRHGGLIWAESTVGDGATFYFTIPD